MPAGVDAPVIVYTNTSLLRLSPPSRPVRTAAIFCIGCTYVRARTHVRVPNALQ